MRKQKSAQTQNLTIISKFNQVKLCVRLKEVVVEVIRFTCCFNNPLTLHGQPFCLFPFAKKCKQKQTVKILFKKQIKTRNMCQPCRIIEGNLEIKLYFRVESS